MIKRVWKNTGITRNDTTCVLRIFGHVVLTWKLYIFKHRYMLIIFGKRFHFNRKG